MTSLSLTGDAWPSHTTENSHVTQNGSNSSSMNVYSMTHHRASCGQVTNVIIKGGREGAGAMGPLGERGPPGSARPPGSVGAQGPPGIAGIEVVAILEECNALWGEPELAMTQQGITHTTACSPVAHSLTADSWIQSVKSGSCIIIACRLFASSLHGCVFLLWLCLLPSPSSAVHCPYRALCMNSAVV